MGYHVVDPADLEPEPDRPSEMRYVSETPSGVRSLGNANGEQRDP